MTRHDPRRQQRPQERENEAGRRRTADVILILVLGSSMAKTPVDKRDCLKIKCSSREADGLGYVGRSLSRLWHPTSGQTAKLSTTASLYRRTSALPPGRGNQPSSRAKDPFSLDLDLSLECAIRVGVCALHLVPGRATREHHYGSELLHTRRSHRPR